MPQHWSDDHERERSIRQARHRRSTTLSQRHFSLRAALIFIVTTSSLLLSGSGAPSSGANVARAATPAPLFSVGLARCTFVDTSRSVTNFSTTPPSVLTTSRTLVTEIRYPTPLQPGAPGETPGAPPAERLGGYPLIVFSHGYDVTPDIYAALLDSWAQAGFVVVAPIFPDESAGEVASQNGVNTEGDLANEPADLAFVTKEIVQASTIPTSACPIVHSLVMSNDIAFAGHSDGATAVGMLAYDHGLDPQGVNYATLRVGIDVRAVLLFSGAEDTEQSYATEASRPALLVVQSVADRCNRFVHGVQIYDAIHQANKWFLELRRAHHLPPFDGKDSPAFNLVSATSIQFLQMSLEGVTPSPSLLDSGNQRPALARMFNQERVPPLIRTPRLTEFCSPN